MSDADWTMHGVSADDPKCLHTLEEAEDYIEKTGFLPLFQNRIPGFSLEEMTVPENWWTDDPVIDPWMWRAQIARKRKIAYGKFFEKKAGFISVEWLPFFANYRRDGYDFDALWEDGKASRRQYKVMQFFQEENSEREYISSELKVLAGFGPGGEKAIGSGALTPLMMQLYLCNCGFRKRKNRNGEEYGWDVAEYCTPEHIWGRDKVRSAYSEDPRRSLERLEEHMKRLCPGASEKDILRLLK